jgi:hypothetical protein
VVVVLLVVSITIGAYHASCLQSTVILKAIHDRTNMDKYHPGYFGKVGMRHFHLTRNKLWRPTINVDKLWSLVPAEEKKDLSEDSEVVPVIDVLRHGYGKVLGNGRCVIYSVRGDTIPMLNARTAYQNCPSFSRHDLCRQRQSPFTLLFLFVHGH